MKTVLITGATSGIGMEFARAYAKKGYSLVLTGRRTERLEKLSDELKAAYGVECRLITADLSDEKQCRGLVGQLEGQQIDIFINNAGFGTAGSFLDTNLDKEISMIKVNDIAMHILFKLMLLKMQEQGSGEILNVASCAGHLPAGPYMARYYATKTYMASLTKAVAKELKLQGSGVYAACLCPGPVDTEFNENADVTFALKGITPETCVRECLAGMARRKTVIVPTLTMKMAVFWGRFVPEGLLLNMVGRQQRKKTQR